MRNLTKKSILLFLIAIASASNANDWDLDNQQNDKIIVQCDTPLPLLMICNVSTSKSENFKDKILVGKIAFFDGKETSVCQNIDNSKSTLYQHRDNQKKYFLYESSKSKPKNSKKCPKRIYGGR